MVESILIIREGDFKPNFYIDLMAQFRDFTEKDDTAYDFFVANEDTFILQGTEVDPFIDFEIVLPYKDRMLADKAPAFYWSADNLMDLMKVHDCYLLMLASVTPKNDIVGSDICIQSMQWLYLDKEHNLSLNGETVDRAAVTIIPFMVFLKYPGVDIIVAATNSKLLAIQSDLRDKDDAWYITELFAEDPSTASCVDTLFRPKLNVGSGERIGDTIFQKGEEFSTLDLFSEVSVVGRFPNVVRPQDFTVASNLEWFWEGSLLKFRLPADKVQGFIKIFLDLSGNIDYSQVHESELPQFQFKVSHY
ncbi:hypothetical protein [Yersinia ruckeri]|uniref:hypothetical protein n=1 Tax=Yersinia ruckeri TaxID=29486 RepID=UPI002237E652|nr:hypothetical protein [Yersinia ruckeri]MCW6598671.1 hypothetical protein [Yersinia ruckeri]